MNTISSVYLNPSIVVVNEEISIKKCWQTCCSKLFSEYPTVLCATWQKLLIRALKGGGTVVECLTWDWGVAHSSLTGSTVLCPWVRHINLCSVLVQPRRIHPNIAEKLLTGTLIIKPKKRKKEHWKGLHFYMHRSNATWDSQQCGMCDQQWLRPACAYEQSDQSLC